MRISTTMAMESLQITCDKLDALLVQAEDERMMRDNLIRDAVEAGVSYRSLIKVTGLSRNRLYLIANNPSR